MRNLQMAHEMTPVDAAIIISGILLVVSLFVLASIDEEMPASFSIRVRAVQGFFSSLGKIFWITWLILCFLVLTTALVLKFKFHREFSWRKPANSSKQSRPLHR